MLNNPPNKNCKGRLAIVLHAHLPYVQSDEENSLEEDWFYQAILECYVPLIKSIEESAKLNPINTKITTSFSPTLCAMFENESIRNNFPSWIETRIKILNENVSFKNSSVDFMNLKLRECLEEWIGCNGNLLSRIKSLS